ncbi:hypothetical protein B0H11DRAFT_2258548 [Mycena galericulata]|nr:hypothetical protein B0H11DRAFT_2258548 [Mycena galericulata]
MDPALRTFLLAELVDATRAAPTVSTCKRCGIPDATHRCCDCFWPELLCTACMAEYHAEHPLHRIETWDGVVWAVGSLRQLGVHIHLGHGRRGSCPTPIYNPRYVIVNTRGTHDIGLCFCSCKEARDPHAQLRDAGLLSVSLEMAVAIDSGTVIARGSCQPGGYRIVDRAPPRQTVTGHDCNMPPRKMKRLLKRRASVSVETLESLKLRDTAERRLRRWSEVLVRESEKRLRDYHEHVDRKWEDRWVASFEELASSADLWKLDEEQLPTTTWAGETDGEMPEGWTSPDWMPFYDVAMQELREPERRQMQLDQIQAGSTFMGYGTQSARALMGRGPRPDPLGPWVPWVPEIEEID